MTSSAIIAELPRMREYARYLTRDASRADDLVQDSVARAISALNGNDQPDSMRAWLFSIIRNRHIDNVRRQKIAPDGVSADALEIEHAMPDLRLEASDFLHDLDKAFNGLPDELKETMWLVGVQGYSYAETATVMEIPVGTVRSRVFRARELLRGSMSDYFPRAKGKGDGGD
mgnify:CR=1 FL=1